MATKPAMRAMKAFKVPKIKCEGCAATIQKALGDLAGVIAVRVEIAERDIRVDFDPARVDEAGMCRALAVAGLPAVPAGSDPA